MRRINTDSVLKSLAAVAVVVFSFGAAGELCGGALEPKAPTFGSGFKDNNPDCIKDVVEKIVDNRSKDEKPKNSLGAPIALLIEEGNPRSLIAWNLASGRKLWSVAIPIVSWPVISGSLILFKAGNAVTAHSIDDGRKLWSTDIEQGWDFHGVAESDGEVVVSLGVGGDEPGGYSNGKLLGLKAKSGAKIWEYETKSGVLGEPAMRNGLAFVPWNRNRLAIIDGSNGDEICRVRADNFTVNFVEAGPAGVFYGSNSTKISMSNIVRLTEKSASGTVEGSIAFSPRLAMLKGEPSFGRDAYAKETGFLATRDKMRFHWKPAAKDPNRISISDGRFYLHYWRYIIAFDSDTSQVLWVYRSGSDIQSVGAVQGGAIGVDADGRIFFVDARSGKERWSLETGSKTLGAVFDADGFKPEGKSEQQDPPSVSLKKLILDKDNRMLPIRSYAIGLLSAIPAPEITRDLLEIYSIESLPAPLRESIVESLQSRATGTQFLSEVLKIHYDFLEGTFSPPMNVVAPVLVNMKDRTAVPDLISHFTDHETPVENLDEIVDAIIVLGDASSADKLESFLILYHADASFVGSEEVLAKVAKAYIKLGGDHAAALITHIRADNQTLPRLKTLLTEMILNP